ncbi:hypothetical protein [Methanococcoides methylutens]|uniref:Uncharacterized protein n=1 Tax=Methanococcoides methylutens MM1 TaxID=1434104 RepID=A0A0E3STE6_METMT|nr:hypothetical protein [Methanococcoides methylutens]AKB85887.1 hypothetical protein MCMEM_1834 [Methanococcoides methylutens MM1]
MLTSIISATSLVSSTVVVMMNEIGLPDYDVLTVIVLIVLLSAKEILSASNYWTKSLATSLNMGIFTLLIVFASIVTFKITEII